MATAGGVSTRWHEAHPWLSGVLTIVIAALCVAVVFVGVIWVMGD